MRARATTNLTQSLVGCGGECRGHGLWWLLTLISVIGLPLLIAHRADQRVLYLAEPPEWMRTRRAPSRGRLGRFLDSFVLQLRLRHSFLRCFYVAPGYTQARELSHSTRDRRR